MIRVQPPGPVERVEFGLKDARGSALKKETPPLAHDFFGLSDAIGVTPRSMSFHGKLPARFVKLSGVASALPSPSADDLRFVRALLQ